MLCKYNSRDFQQRVSGGIIFYDGAPHVVVETGRNHFNLRPLKGYPRSAIMNVPANSDLIDLSRRSLGYLNYRGKAYYLLQDPNRQYKQSLSMSGIHAFDVSARRNLGPQTAMLSDALYGSPGYNMLMNIYPSVESTFNKLETKKASSIAISKNVAIAIDSLNIKRIFYKQVEVGYTTPDLVGKIIVPSDEYAHIISRFLSDFSWEVE